MWRFQIHGKKIYTRRTFNPSTLYLEKLHAIFYFYFSYKKKSTIRPKKERNIEEKKSIRIHSTQWINVKIVYAISFYLFLIRFLFANDFGFHSVSFAHLHSRLLATLCRCFVHNSQCEIAKAHNSVRRYYTYCTVTFFFFFFIVIFFGRFVFIRRRSRVRARSHSPSQFHFHFPSLSPSVCLCCAIFFGSM